MPTVSVQIVTYNSEEDICNCLDSVIGQTFPIERVFVIDNNSNENTVNKVRYFKDVSLIVNDFNNGFAGAHNQAVEISNTDYILVLNPDIVLDKNYLLRLIVEMENDKTIGLATGKLYRDIKNKILDSTGLEIKKNRRGFDRGSGEKDIGQFDNHRFLFGVSGAAALYRRNMINDISINGQFFDETFFAYKEDVDVSWRAQLLGWKAIFVPSAVATHERGWKEEKKRNDIPIQIRKHSYINRYYCMLKNDQPIFLIKHLPFILFYELLSLGYAVIREPKILAAWKEFYNNFDQMKQSRRIIQSRKRKENLNSVHSFFKGFW